VSFVRSRWLRTAAGLLVAALFVTLLARRVDWSEVRRVLAGAQWAPLMIGLLALAGDMTARIIRWWVMLRAAEPELSLGSCVRPLLGSLALNNTVPLRAGDVVRIFGFKQTLRAPTAHIVGTLVLERMLDLLVLVAILFVGVLGTSGIFPRPFMLLAAAAGIAAVAGLLAITLFPDAITSLVQRLVTHLFAGRKWLPVATGAVAQLTASLALLRLPARAVRLLGLSFLAWFLEGAVFACVARSLQISVHWTAPWLSLGAATLATLLPSSPGYVGTFDYFASLGLTAYGAPPSVATAFALLTHLMLWLPVTLVGFIAILVHRGGKTPASLGSELRSEPSVTI
jgi:glycosyltransferase 2 family protein